MSAWLPRDDLAESTRRVRRDPLFVVPEPVAPVESDPRCLTCGLCCAVPAFRPTSLSEQYDIAAFLGVDLATLRARYLRPDAPDNLRAPCTFLTRSGGRFQCSIYPVRPSGCRAFGRCVVVQGRAEDPAAEIAAAQARWAAYVDAVPGD